MKESLTSLQVASCWMPSLSLNSLPSMALPLEQRQKTSLTCKLTAAPMQRHELCSPCTVQVRLVELICCSLVEKQYLQKGEFHEKSLKLKDGSEKVEITWSLMLLMVRRRKSLFAFAQETSNILWTAMWYLVVVLLHSHAECSPWCGCMSQQPSGLTCLVDSFVREPLVPQYGSPLRSAWPVPRLHDAHVARTSPNRHFKVFMGAFRIHWRLLRVLNQ